MLLAVNPKVSIDSLEFSSISHEFLSRRTEDPLLKRFNQSLLWLVNVDMTSGSLSVRNHILQLALVLEKRVVIIEHR